MKFRVGVRDRMWARTRARVGSKRLREQGQDETKTRVVKPLPAPIITTSYVLSLGPPFALTCLLGQNRRDKRQTRFNG